MACIGGLGLLLISSALCILIGLDLWISQKRWKQGVKDLNPVVQFGVKNYGRLGGSSALLASNLILLTGLWLLDMPMLLAIFLGVKLGLASLQIRSLIENEYSNSGKSQLRK